MHISNITKYAVTLTIITFLSACRTTGSDPKPNSAKACFEADVKTAAEVNVTPNPDNLLQGTTRTGKWYRVSSGDLSITFGEQYAIYKITDYDGKVLTRLGDYKVENDKIEVIFHCFDRVDTLFIKPSGFIEGSYKVNGKNYGDIRLNPAK